MGQPAEARKTYARLTAVARNDGERRAAHFWTAMSYVHEGATDPALAELSKMAAIDTAGGDLVALSGALAQMGNVLLEASRVDEAAAKFGEQVATIDEARVALARNDVATAKAKSAAYATAVTVKSIPFEVRQSHELAGRIALAEKSYAVAVAELRQANQQDPRVLYLSAVALQGKGDLQAAKDATVQAADFNGLSNTYGYVRGKARAMMAGTTRY
jgi:tetratricopeptide (TPR) repeat protein